MDTLKKKLRSARGASIIIAMLFFFLCATVGAVILTAASVNLQRTGVSYAENQTYLTLSSAARLLSAQIKPLALEMTQEKTYYACCLLDPAALIGTRCDLRDENQSKIVYSEPTLAAASTTPVGQIIETAATQVCSGATELYVTTFTLDAELDNGNLQTVTAKLSIDENYELIIVLSLDDEDYTPIELVFDPTLTIAENPVKIDTCDHGEDIDLYTKTTTVSWNLKYSDITRGGMTIG